MTIRRLSLAAGLVLAAVGCSNDDLITPPVPQYKGGAMFQRYVAMGNSITAGFQSGGINDSTQQQSYVALVAGKMGSPYNHPYSATKAGLVGLTQSLRAEYVDSPIGFYIPIASTLANAAMGFVIGSIFGLLIGSLMAEFRSVETVLMPYAFALQTLPKVALAPLIVIWFGFGNGSKIAMAALLAFFPLMVNSFTGIRNTEPERIDLMRSLSASRLEIYARVKLPSAAPFIFAGLDMAAVYALLGLLVEMLRAELRSSHAALC